MQDSGPRAFPNFVQRIDSGGKSEPHQEILAFWIVNDNKQLFRVQPDIDNGGQLTFTLLSNATGIATVKVRVRDNVGTANDGIDTSETIRFVNEVCWFNI